MARLFTFKACAATQHTIHLHLAICTAIARLGVIYKIKLYAAILIIYTWGKISQEKAEQVSSTHLAPGMMLDLC